jgi:cobalt-precorrin-5B (C1)-methyltransferase
VEISVPGGREIAAKTFNPRLGIEGGLSILGTTGIVRPYCTRALHDALKCALDVAAACGATAPVLVPGNIGTRAARRHFSLREEQVIEVGNEWGFVLDLLSRHVFRAVLLLGHPGKLAKLAADQWDTHSARSNSAAHYLSRVCPEVLGHPAPDSTTAEGVFAALSLPERTALGQELAKRVRLAAAGRIAQRIAVAVFLVNMAGECLGSDGDLTPWQ